MTKRHTLAVALFVATLIAGGCSSDSNASNNASDAIQPIEPILASDIDIVSDPTGTSATFNVDTTIPVACAVIYGTDGSFGSLAVDNDMQGGAHEEHGPLLTGLTPDTEYQYVLQGSDAAGTIYRSDTLTFRTPEATETGLGSNVAASATVTAFSSEFSDAFAAGNAIDGNLATEWSTNGDGDEAWIEIDLGDEQEISAVAFRTRQMSDGTAITETFTITIDGETVGPFATGTDPVPFDPALTGQIVRIDADQTTGGNTGAAEIEIYGAA